MTWMARLIAWSRQLASAGGTADTNNLAQAITRGLDRKRRLETRADHLDRLGKRP